MVFECNFEFVQRSAIWVLHMKATLIAGDVLSHTDTLACSTVVFASRRRAGFRPAMLLKLLSLIERYFQGGALITFRMSFETG